MTSQLNVDTIVDKAGSGGPSLPNTTTIKISNTSTNVSDGGAVTQNTVQGLCKMWARLDGTGTISLDDSFNVGSITDNTTGQYTYTFSNNMNNANFNVAHASANQIQIHSTEATSSVTILCRDQNNSNEDVDPTFSNVHGDLA
jgi:VCBS repeat-containing protein